MPFSEGSGVTGLQHSVGVAQCCRAGRHTVGPDRLLSPGIANFILTLTAFQYCRRGPRLSANRGPFCTGCRPPYIQDFVGGRTCHLKQFEFN